jgi:hypothetical protein
VLGPNKKESRCRSVADPGCLSLILIFTHPGSRIQKQQQKRRVKRNSCHTYFWSHKFHKMLKNYFTFEMLRKKICAYFQELPNFLPQKLSLCSQKYGFGIRDPEKTYSGSQIPDLGSRISGSRIRIRNVHAAPYTQLPPIVV